MAEETSGGSQQGLKPRKREFRRYVARRKICAFCADKVAFIDYKDIARLRRYLSDRARIEPRRKTGTCAKHQRILSVALKRARHLALLPFTAEQMRWLMGGLAPSRPAMAPPAPAPVAQPAPAPVAQPVAAETEAPAAAEPEAPAAEAPAPAETE